MSRPELPADFVARMRAWLGDADGGALVRALEEPPERGLRRQHDRIDEATLRAHLPWDLTPVPWSPFGAYLGETTVSPGSHPLHEAGAFYLQDPAAMAPAAALAVRPGERVIDLAAAPGGKATALSADLAGSLGTSVSGRAGWLVANDVHPARRAELARNLERVGARDATVTGLTPDAWARLAPGGFDVVLLDAPCSGEGMFRKSDAARSAWSEATVASCAARQDELLDAAARLLAPGGRLAYATCTFAPEENEAVVASLAGRRPDLRPSLLRLPGTEPGDPGVAGAGHLPPETWARIWPHRARGDGHVVALLTRDPGADPGAPIPPRDTDGDGAGRGRSRRGRRDARTDGGEAADRAVRTAWAAFAAATLAPAAAAALAEPDEERLWVRGGVVWRRAGPAERSTVPSLRPGLALGRVRGDRFVPEHALAHALRPGEARAGLELPPEGPAIQAWLAGEELDVERATLEGGRLLGDADRDGWLQVTVAGCGVGWARRSGTRVRNLRPKGLRRR